MGHGLTAGRWPCPVRLRRRLDQCPLSSSTPTHSSQTPPSPTSIGISGWLYAYRDAMAPPRSDSIHHDGGALLSVPFDPAFDGDFPSFKFLVMLLDRGSGRLREAVEALRVEDEGLMKGLSALHVAAGRGNLDMCRYLVEDLGVDANVVDGEGRTPLFWTVLSKNVGAAKYLLDHGANQDKANHDGFSPLHQAVESGLPL
uniref:Uncharacterized protein n=1 Tax=Avena sativa TaxID=4498 RepID=A0ACD5TZE0_AVESA